MRSRFLMLTARKAVIAPILFAVGGYAAPDIPGSADPGGMARFSGAWIIVYSPETEHRSYEFITGAGGKDSTRGAHRAQRFERMQTWFA